ncbi:MAG: hypothetical protein NW241_06300 [Bacteroidia bacterium]|nr:hypothetical protein [Bacteroidia bacterium]
MMRSFCPIKPILLCFLWVVSAGAARGSGIWNLTGEPAPDGVVLHWQGPLSPDDLPEYQVVQRKVRGGSFEFAAGFRVVSGDPGTFTDRYAPAGEPLTYRIKQVSRSGAVQYSEEVTVVPPAADIRLASAGGQTLLLLPAWMDSRATLDLLDLNGRICWHAEPGGLQTVELPMAPLPSGLYYVRAAQDGIVRTLPCLKP